MRAPLAGLVAGLRAAPTELCVVVPVDCPALTADALRRLAAACLDAAVPQTGPLPGAYRRRALPVLERRLAAGELKLRDALAELDVAEVELPAELLVNVNRPGARAGVRPCWALTTPSRGAPVAGSESAARPRLSDRNFGLSSPPTRVWTRSREPRAERRTRPPRVEVSRHPSGERERDLVAVEEPLEIRIGGEPVAVTMRTPGARRGARARVRRRRGTRPGRRARARGPRGEHGRARACAHSTPSGCGGTSTPRPRAASAGRARSRRSRSTRRRSSRTLRVGAALLAALPDRLREAQPTFALTGGLHATGLFAADGELLCVREDVGRHNALDKVVGWAFRDGRLPLAGAILCVSGRLSFELVQKAALAGCPVLVGVGAPSSLAVELADAQRVTLCGFARGGRVTVYADTGRIA